MAQDDSIVDRLGRPIRDLRISVIDKCNLRCTYCMPAEEYHEGYRFLPDDQLLTFDEIERAARAFVSLGVTKLRITGGEPLLRRNLPELVERLAAIDGTDDLALTTNGVFLPQHAEALRAAGLQRVTVSLDAIDESTAQQMNGRGKGSAEILKGIAAAEAAGFPDIKLNVVVQRGVNEDEIDTLVDHFRGTGHVIRFIEYMDVGNRNHWNADQVVTSKAIHERIHARYPLRPLSPNYHGEVANRYAFEDGQGEIGFISSISEPFCGSCTRARLSADGRLYTCLFAANGTDLRTLLKDGAGEDELVQFITAVWRQRTDRYSELRAVMGASTERKVEMYEIGG